MKYLLIAPLFCFLLISCSTTKPLPTEDELVDTGILTGEATLDLYSIDKADTAQSSIRYAFYEVANEPYQDTINRIVKEYVSGVFSHGAGMTDQNSNISVDFIEQSLQGFGDEYNRELEIVEGGAIWSSETDIEIIEDHKDYVEVSFHTWSYEGGAHGNAWSEQRIIEIKTGKELFLVDFITDVDELTSIAEEIFRADQELSPDEDLNDAGFWFEDAKFALNENFVMNAESIDFLYNQYEIAPYAAGMIFLSVPLEKVRHLLKRK